MKRGHVRVINSLFPYIAYFSLGGMLLQGQSANEPLVSLPESIKVVSGASSDAQSPYISRSALATAELSSVLEIEFVLKFRNLEELRARVERSERISNEDMKAKFHPAALDYTKIVVWLRRQGLTVTLQDKSHTAIFATGSVSQIERALKVKFSRVTYRNHEYSSAITAPMVPASIAAALVGINGLQPHIQYQKQIVLKTSNLSSSNPPYLPSQLATAYNANGLYSSNVTGSGQTIAIIIDAFPKTSDLLTFWQRYGINQSLNNISFIQVTAGTMPAPSGEETLDTEWSSSVAPSAKVRVYGVPSLSTTGVDQCYVQVYQDVIANPGLGINQMSMSFGAPENGMSSSQLQTDTQYLYNLASAGVTIFVASGDQGANPDPSFGLPSGALSAESPASDPSVISVGGTSLTVDSSGKPTSEISWNNAYGATGGGISGYFSRPAWQNGLGVPFGTARLVPDIASAADPLTGAVVILNGSELEFGGTSWGAPTWAGFCALLNQNRAKSGLPPMGLLGPTLYALNGTTTFRDVTSGNNNFGGATGYSTGVGYDLCTGLGIPEVSLLAQSVSRTNPPSITDGPPPSSASTASTYIFTYTASGQPTPTFSLGSGSLPPGLSLTAAGVISGTPTTMGTFTGAVTAQNGVNPSASQAFSITVSGSIVIPAFSNKPPTSATVALPLSFTDAATGQPSPSFTVTTGSLPTGLTLSSNGVLSGTPSKVGTFKGVITASNGSSSKATQSFGLSIVANPLSKIVLTTNLHNAPYSLTQDPSGSFYTTTNNGGPSGKGLISKITSAGVETVLHNFGDGSVLNDGFYPNGLVRGTDGNFYGTTYSGGAGQGAIFKMSPQGVVTILHLFRDGSTSNDGALPEAGLIEGKDGNFYGTTVSGGVAGWGVVFKISPQGAYAILHHFDDGSVTYDGQSPYAPLIQSASGNFFGTSFYGGSASNQGAVFMMTPAGKVTILHSFGDGKVKNDGINPLSGLAWGSDGHLYGTTSYGGTASLGALFSLTQTGAYTLLHSIGDGTIANEGDPTFSNLSTGPDGNIYGLSEGSGYVGTGSLFQISAAGLVRILHSFGDGTLSGDGIYPLGNLIVGLDGSLYGTGSLGGTFGLGTLFKATLAPSAPAVTSTAPPVTGSVGATYNFTFTATGYPPPTFTVSSGSLPPGLTLTPTGVLSGTPTVPGAYPITISVSNGVGTASKVTFTITVPGSVPTPATDTPTMPQWALMLLAALLLIVAARGKEQVPTRS